MNAVANDRTKYMGGGDVPALLGIAPPTWRRNSPVALYYDKITPRAEGETDFSGVLRRGKRWESVVDEMLTEELTARGHRVQIVGGNRRLTDAEHPFFRAEIDREILLDDDPRPWNLELKTVHPFKERDWGESDTDEAPDHALAQLLWGLGVTQREHGIVAALFGADKLKVYPIETPDPLVISAIRQKAFTFWTEHVLKRVPPTPLFLADMGLLHPVEGDGLLPLAADAELTETLLRLRAIDREMKARQAEFDALEFSVKRAMGATAEVTVDGKVAVTWKQRKFAYLDERGLKKAHPRIHKEFFRRGTTRAFVLKGFAYGD